MKSSVRSSLLLGAVSILTITTAANAAFVSYSPTAPESNFGAPTSASDNVAYNINLSANSTYVFVNAAIAPAQGGALNGLDFVNLYFATAGGGSTIGFEIGNNDAFIPGGAGPVSTAGLGISYTESTPGNWNIQIPWSYFETDPNGLGFTEISATNNVLRLNLSQSFGYSVAGGLASYGSSELGQVTLSVPEASATLPLMGVAFAGLALARKRFFRA